MTFEEFHGPSFLLGGVLPCLLYIAYLSLRDSSCRWIGRKRLSYTTKYGQKVYEMDVKSILGFSLAKAQLDLLEEVFMEVASGEMYGWELDKMKKFFANNSIYFHPHPIRDPVPGRENGTGFVNAYYEGNIIHLGVLPFIYRTGLAHELVHDMLQEFTGNSDPGHLQGKFFENGLVGLINQKLEEKFAINSIRV